MTKEEASGYASFATISSVQIGFVSANITYNNDDDLHRHMKAQEQVSRAQEEALDNIQHMLSQLMKNRNDEDDSDNCYREEENRKNEEEEHSKGSSSIDTEVIKDIQAQIVFLAQLDELKKVGMTRPHPLEWDSVLYPPKFKSH